jgi:hypothetical protein
MEAVYVYMENKSTYANSAREHHYVCIYVRGANARNAIEVRMTAIG